MSKISNFDNSYEKENLHLHKETRIYMVNDKLFQQVFSNLSRQETATLQLCQI